jgi:hypothetical protein
VAERRHGLAHGHALALGIADLGGRHGVGALGQRRARHDARRLARPDRAREDPAGQHLADHAERERVVVRGAEGVAAADGIAVHRGAREARHVHGGAHVRREHAPDAVEQRHLFGWQCAHALGEEALHLLDVRARGEAAHAHVTQFGLLIV